MFALAPAAAWAQGITIDTPIDVAVGGEEPPAETAPPSTVPDSTAPEASPPTSSPAQPPPAEPASDVPPTEPPPTSDPRAYVVEVAPGVDPAGVAAQEASLGNDVDEVFDTAVDGFAVELELADVVRLDADPRVTAIEPDQVLTLDGTQPNPPWGLDRIDQAALPLDVSYTYDNAGAGATVYVIDTGVRADHNDFSGRVGSGFDAIADGQLPGTDCHGHGTHVAGTIGGEQYGVAKDVTIIPVRVLNCQGSGTTSSVLAGIDWVTEQHQAGQPAVANMSLGGGMSSILDNAVERSVVDGVTYAVAAGNENTNACNRSPARAAAAITVGATTNTDARAGYSNWGTCVDLFAPGSGILSAGKSSPSATATMSGTSMASPHVAGVAAIVLAADPSASPAAVTDAILVKATSGVGVAGTGSPDLLLQGRLGPAYDLFSQPVVIEGESGSLSTSSADATHQLGEPSHGGPGGSSVWFSWTAPTTSNATFETLDSDFDTLLAAYTGTSVGSLTPLAANDDGDGIAPASRITFLARAGHTYRIAVDGAGGATGDVQLSWTTEPASFQQPDAQIKRNGGTLVGAGVYANIGAQTVRADRKRGKGVDYLVRLVNDGTDPGRIKVRGSSGSRQFAVRYYAGKRNVSKQVAKGYFAFSNVAPGAMKTLRIQVVPRSGARKGSTRTAAVTARTSDGSADVVRAITRAR